MKLLEFTETKIAELDRNGIVINDAQEMLELLMNQVYQDITKLILYEENLSPSFFDLKSGLAGDILQKFSNYQACLAIVGDHSKHNSNSLKDFIRESNRQGHISFVSTREEAIAALLKV